MELYLEYFTNLEKFVFKKDILNDIKDLFNKELNSSDYTKLINSLLLKKVIAKSTNAPGKCAYISCKYIDNKNTDAISLYQSLKVDSRNITFYSKNIILDTTIIQSDCIVDINIEELLNEL